MSVWKKLKVGYRKLLHRPKSLGKGGKNGSGLVLKMGCGIVNWNLKWRLNSILRWSCLYKLLNLKIPSFFVMASKNNCFATNCT